MSVANRGRVSQAISWSAVDLLVRSGLNAAVLIVLARVLAPADFGLMAMLALFVALATLLVDSGFSLALIQRQGASHVDESTIFFFTVGMAVVVAALLSALAPWIANFYKQPILREMTWWMALNLFLNSFGTIHTALLTKNLDFRTLAKATGSASVISGCVALILALQGFGVWSLIGQALAFTVTMVMLLWLLHPWRPIWIFDSTSLRSYFGFGGYVLWSGLLNVMYRNLYALLIGKMHPVEDVGYYSQARRVQDLPVRALTGIVDRVSFPVFASVANNKSRLTRMLSKAITAIFFVTAPLMVGLAVLVEPLTVLVFGDKWLPMAPVLEALAIAGLVSPLNQMNLNALKAQGYAALNAKIQLIRVGIAIFLLLVTSPYGIVAVAYGQALASLLAFVVNTYYTRKYLDYGGLAQLRDVLPYLAACVPMAILVWLTSHIPFESGALSVPTSVLVGAASYILICRMSRLEALDHFLNMLRRR